MVDRKTKKSEILLAADHAGFGLKEKIKRYLIKKGKKVTDLGTKSKKSVDYPLYSHLLSKKIKSTRNSFGILICGSGEGMVITANKHKKIRAALCYNIRAAKLSRLHNNANVMALGSRFIKQSLALNCVNVFLKTEFEGGRHLKRINKI